METKVCKVCGQELPLSEFKKTTGSTNSELAKFTPRELIEELKSRGYKGKLYVTRTIKL